VPRIPPDWPKRRHDPNQWRNDPGGKGRRPVSTTQIFLGILLLAVASSAAVFCFGFTDSDGIEADIVSPDDGAELPAGTVVVRISVSAGDDPPRWDISYRGPDTAGAWTEIASGSSAAFPTNAGGNGFHVLELTQPGDYAVRLVVQNGDNTEERTDTVEFTVTP
jgi:hypothetical protein